MHVPAKVVVNRKSTGRFAVPPICKNKFKVSLKSVLSRILTLVNYVSQYSKLCFAHLQFRWRKVQIGRGAIALEKMHGDLRFRIDIRFEGFPFENEKHPIAMRCECVHAFAPWTTHTLESKVHSPKCGSASAWNSPVLRLRYQG